MNNVLARSAMVVLTCGCVISSFAQAGDGKTLSLFTSVGYGFAVGGKWIGSSDKFNNNLDPSESHDVYLNAGRGLKFDVGAFYRMMQNVDVKACFAFTGSVPRTTTTTEATAGTVITKTVDTYKYATFGINALVVPRFTVFDLLDVFAGIGMGLAFPVSSSEEVTTINAGTTTTTTTTKIEDSNLPEPVFIGELGAEYPIIKELILSCAVNIEAMTVTTTKQVVTQVESNDVTTINYEDHATDRAPTPATPATNVSIRLGVRVPIF